VVVSHDAAFLDAVITDVLLLAHARRQLEHHQGSYSDFRVAKPEVHAYLTRRTDMAGNTTLAAGDKFTLNFPKPDRLDGVGSDTKSVVRLSAVTFAYPNSGAVDPSSARGSGCGGDQGDSSGEGEGAAVSSASGSEPELKVVLRHVNCRLTLRSKVACIGGNGAGKSTLVRLLVGDLLPLTGDVWRHPSLRLAYVAQHSLGHIEQHLNKSAVEYLQWRFNGAVDREALAMSALQQQQPPGGGSAESADPNAFVLERIIARRTKGGRLEYECKFVGRGHDENEWRSLLRLSAEGHEVDCLRFDQVRCARVSVCGGGALA
jgi:elongation factor 3